jgi:hypothetical protein
MKCLVAQPQIYGPKADLNEQLSNSDTVDIGNHF